MHQTSWNHCTTSNRRGRYFLMKSGDLRTEQTHSLLRYVTPRAIIKHTNDSNIGHPDTVHTILTSESRLWLHAGMSTLLLGIVWSNAYVPGWYLSLKATDGPSSLPLTTCVRCHVRTTASETEALELPVREFGTVCHAAWEHLRSVTNSLKRYWKHICLTHAYWFL